MSKRLQVLVEPGEYKQFQHIAEKKGVSMGEWVRQVLRQATASSSGKSTRQKLEHIRHFCRFKLPSGDIEQILAEIEKGYLSGDLR